MAVEPDLSYAAWPANTILTLCNVPWDINYRDIVRFDDRAKQRAYFNDIAADRTSITGSSYAKLGAPIRISMPLTEAMKYNYIRATNPAPGGRGSEIEYYYFITGVDFASPDTTVITVQLDVVQTFLLDVKFGQCFVERGHIGMAHTKSFDNLGRDYLTVPEGFDLGGDYRIFRTESRRLMDRIDGQRGTAVDILVASAVDLGADPGSVDPGTGGPKITMANGSNFGGLPSGSTYYLFRSIPQFRAFLQRVRDQSWVSSAILGIWVIPDITRYLPDFEYNNVGGTGASDVPSQDLNPIVHELAPGWRGNGLDVAVRYRNLMKFYTYPYMVIELTTFGATPVMLKPELWNDDHGTIVERVSLLPPDQRIMFNPYKYNAKDRSQPQNLRLGQVYVQGGDDGGEWLDTATFIQNLPTLAILNDGAIGYLAANFHSLAFQPRAQDWSQQKALRSNQVGYDQATQSMNAATFMGENSRWQDAAGTQASLEAMVNSSALSALTGVVGGAQSGAMGGAVAGPHTAAAGAALGGISGVAGAAFTPVSNALNTQAANQQLAIRQSASRGASTVGNQTAAFNRDTNKELSDWAARGNYEMEQAGMLAKVQDAQLAQPTTSGQLGGELLAILNSSVRFSLRFKMIDNAAVATIGEHWLRYGYAVMRRTAKLPDNLRVMSNFTYWKLSETYIESAPMPEVFKLAIRGIFEKGVTVWRDPAQIGKIDIANNTPLEGITL